MLSNRQSSNHLGNKILTRHKIHGRIQDFKLGGGGGGLKKIAPSGGRRENCWGISPRPNRDSNSQLQW
jgi:hypothetical protein